jgi:hypothetical protein
MTKRCKLRLSIYERNASGGVSETSKVSLCNSTSYVIRPGRKGWPARNGLDSPAAIEMQGVSMQDAGCPMLLGLWLAEPLLVVLR